VSLRLPIRIINQSINQYYRRLGFSLLALLTVCLAGLPLTRAWTGKRATSVRRAVPVNVTRKISPAVTKAALAAVQTHNNEIFDTINNGDWAHPLGDKILSGGGSTAGTFSFNGLPLASGGNPTRHNIYHRESDFEFIMPNTTIPLVRHYNKNLKRDGHFGYGWTSLFDVSLITVSETKMRLLREDGSSVYYDITGGGTGFVLLSPKHFTSGLTVTPGGISTPGGYTLTLKNGWVYNFNTAGHLIAVKDRNNATLTLQRDTLNRVTRVTDPFGRQYVVNYFGGINPGPHVRNITFNGDTVATHSYSGFNHATVTFADGSQYKHTYASHLSLVRNAMNHILMRWTMDANNRVLSIDRDGGVDKVTYDYVREPVTGALAPNEPGETHITDALGRVTKIFFTNPGNATCNGTGCPLAPINLHGVTRIERDSVEGVLVTTYVTDSNDRIQSMTDPAGRMTAFAYDDDGNVLALADVLGTLSFTYNQFAQVLTATDWAGGVTTNVYDGNGNLTSTTDMTNVTRTFSHNGLGQVTSATDGRGIATSFSYTNGVVTSQTTSTATTTYSYHARGWLTGVTTAAGLNITYGRDAVGRVTSVSEGGATTSYAYDLAGRRTTATDPLGNQATFLYDDAFRLISTTTSDGTSNYTYDRLSNPRTAADPLGRVTTMAYDNLDRLTRITYPTGLIERFGYDISSNRISHTDTAGRITRYVYDTADRLVREIAPDGGITRYVYNTRSQVTDVYDPLNQRHGFGYDELGRTTSMQRGGRTWSFMYDGNGNRTKRTDAKGDETTYLYSNLNRLTTITYADGGTVTFGYDNAGRMTSATNANGTVSFTLDTRNRVTGTTDVWNQTINYGYDDNNNRTQMTMGTSQTSYAYGALNRLTAMTHNTMGATTFGYDSIGRLTSRTLPNGVTATAQYDNLDRLERLTYAKNGNNVADWQYQFNNAQVIEQIITNALETKTFAYDDVDRLTGVTRPNSPAESYSYDKVGNRTASHLSALYDYNSFNRLMGVDGKTFTYDANGNLRTKVTAEGAWVYAWDEENRLIRVQRPDGLVVNYRYDALGRRVERRVTANGTTTWKRFTYDGMDVVLDREPGNVTMEYGNGFGLDNKLWQKPSTGNALYYVTDHLGSTHRLTVNEHSETWISAQCVAFHGVLGKKAVFTASSPQALNRETRRGTHFSTFFTVTISTFLRARQQLTRADGFANEEFIYDAYGNVNTLLIAEGGPPVAGDNSRPNRGSAQTRYDYTGRERDADTGLLYYRARWYDSETGRFLSEDPIGLAGGKNLYEYVEGNPVSLTDASGLCGKCSENKPNATDDCLKFVDFLLSNYSNSPSPLLGPALLGYRLAAAAAASHRTLSYQDRKYMPTGFRSELVGSEYNWVNGKSNYQGSDVFQHVLAHAGNTLIAHLPSVNLGGFAKDTNTYSTGNSVSDGALAQDRDETIPGRHGNIDPDGAQARQEVAGDLAGRTIGRLFNRAYKINASADALRPHLANILCGK
jgi:RHS repeat-associated protein